MIKEVTIVPAILTNNKQDYRAQVERINAFTRRVQIDVSDGIFAPPDTLNITEIWWPKDWQADLHCMMARPSQNLDLILRLNPSLCILHAEASENLLPVIAQLKGAGIKVGIALMPETFPGNVKQYIDESDHVMIFAGHLGLQGMSTDMMQVEKIPLIREMKEGAEIGWDGGANMTNVRALAHADLNVINVGAAISRAPDPSAAYKELVAEIDKNGVVI